MAAAKLPLETTTIIGISEPSANVAVIRMPVPAARKAPAAAKAAKAAKQTRTSS